MRRSPFVNGNHVKSSLLVLPLVMDRTNDVNNSLQINSLYALTLLSRLRHCF